MSESPIGKQERLARDIANWSAGIVTTVVDREASRIPEELPTRIGGKVITNITKKTPENPLTREK